MCSFLLSWPTLKLRFAGYTVDLKQFLTSTIDRVHQTSAPCVLFTISGTNFSRQTSELKLENLVFQHQIYSDEIHCIKSNTCVLKCYAGVYLDEERGSVQDCSITVSAGFLPLFERLLTKFCPDVAVGRCSRWQCIELHLVKLRLTAVKIRIPKAPVIPPAVQFKIVLYSSDPNWRWLSFCFCVIGSVISLIFERSCFHEEFQGALVSHHSQFWGWFPHSLSTELRQLSNKRHLSIASVTLFLSRHLCRQMSTGPHLGSSTTHLDAGIR